MRTVINFSLHSNQQFSSLLCATLYFTFMPPNSIAVDSQHLNKRKAV